MTGEHFDSGVFMKFTTAVLTALFFFSVHAYGQQTEKLRALISETMTNNPEISAAIYTMWSAQEKVPQASSLDDPELIFKLMEIPGTNFNQAMYANVELMQMIRFPSKLSTQRMIAETRAEHAHHDHIEKVNEVLLRLKTTYAMLRYSRAVLDLNRTNQGLLEQVLTAATTQYSVGQASQQDVLKSNIELAKLKAEEETLKQEVTSSESMLRAILNRPSDKPIGILVDDGPKRVAFGVDDLVRYAFVNRPMLVHDSLNVYESNLALDLMKQEYLPDFKVSLEYVRMPVAGENRWSVSAGLTLPFAPWTLSKASSRVQEASADRSMLESTFEASKRMVEAQIRNSYAKVRAIETQTNTYDKTILPQTDQSLKTVLQEYQTNQTSFLMLLDSYRMYQETKMEAAMLRMKYDEAVAALENNVGVTDINSIQKEKLQ
jgi:cobalt-zinc-cadmium efflux system outer membrane protein